MTRIFCVILTCNVNATRVYCVVLTRHHIETRVFCVILTRYLNITRIVIKLVNKILYYDTRRLCYFIPHRNETRVYIQCNFGVTSVVVR